MASIIFYLGAMFVAPRRGFRRLLTEKKRFAKGFRIMLFIGILYTISIAGLAVAGALLPAPGFLPLDSHNYYFYEMFFALPAFIGAWLLASGAGTIVSLALRGRGPFKAAAAAWAYAFAAPLFLMWLPHAAFSGFLTLGMSQKEFMSYTAAPGPWQIGFWIYQGLAVLLLVVGSAKAAAVGRSLRGVFSVITGLIAAG
ncbi:MAG: hypothetical protein ACYDH3_08410, partial [Candidatus Aminicenantales bacterium]